MRTYSDLGIRLHYGHPDVFHAPWASAHSGLSKVNPDINTSEDVFAGFMTMSCNENTKHLEHIQFQKGRETGLANMSSFDTKISQGNAGILRSRDLYYLMERHDYITNFLLFQGVSGHFTTISLMMWSMRLYIGLLFLVCLSGASLKSFGGLTYSTEWLFHAGLTTIIPLVVEFLVEYGPVIGLLQTLFFLPVSTMIYLFQMQTKHEAFIKGIVTGKAVHIDTGRGLAIYRIPMVTLFKNYGQSHVYPIFYVIAGTIAYKTLSNDLGGGTLPLIMIYFLCAAVLLSPALFNPAIYGGSLRELGLDMLNFMTWIGKTESRLYLQESAVIEQHKHHQSLLSYFIVLDYDNLPITMNAAIRSTFYHLAMLIFWLMISIFLLYPAMQFWAIFFLSFWGINVIIYSFIFYLFQSYEQPLRIINIYIGIPVAMAYFLINNGKYGILDFAEIYVSFLVVVKLLEALRAGLCDAIVISSLIRYPKNLDTTLKVDLIREKYLTLMLHVINKFFFVNAARISIAFLWGVCAFIISLLMRPIISNMFLFGKYIGSKDFHFLEPMRKLRAKQGKFGVKV
uniref:Glycosyl transferase 48 domain-containing protein n=1 Tax=Arcella intermedia TaxID=1963864 RepID=A0A6B2L105_9EUKA